MPKRASPLPKPPDDVTEDPLELVVPGEFFHGRGLSPVERGCREVMRKAESIRQRCRRFVLERGGRMSLILAVRLPDAHQASGPSPRSPQFIPRVAKRTFLER